MLHADARRIKRVSNAATGKRGSHLREVAAYDSGQLEILVDGHQFSRPADSGSPGGGTGFFFR